MPHGHQDPDARGHQDPDVRGHQDPDAHGHQDPDAHGHQDPDAHGHHSRFPGFRRLTRDSRVSVGSLEIPGIVVSFEIPIFRDFFFSQKIWKNCKNQFVGLPGPLDSDPEGEPVEGTGSENFCKVFFENLPFWKFWPGILN